MADDAFKQAEHRGYSKGYQAGKKRRAKEIERERMFARQTAFRQRAFLAALPSCINANGWKAGDKPINTLTERVALAWDFADEAVKRFY